MFKKGAFMKWVEGMEGEVVRKGEMDFGRGEVAAAITSFSASLSVKVAHFFSWLICFYWIICDGLEN